MKYSNVEIKQNKNIENNILPQLILQLKNYKIILFLKQKFLQNTHTEQWNLVPLVQVSINIKLCFK